MDTAQKSTEILCIGQRITSACDLRPNLPYFDVEVISSDIGIF